MPREKRHFKICRCASKWRCKCLIPYEKKAHPPFNAGLKLGVKLGMHPKLYSLAESPAVGSYNPESVRCRRMITSWKRQMETKELSSAAGGRLFEKRVVQTNLMRSGNGPGTHEIPRWPESILDGRCKSTRRDVGFGTVPLFQPSFKSTTPGPGYILRVHNPYYYLDQKRLKSFSCIPSFEYDNLAPRFREYRRTWSLPCNRYEVKYPDSLEAFLEKSTGKRGPYDVFTGPRDDSTIIGHFARKRTEDRGDWPRKLPGETEKLLHKSNYFKARWSTCPRFPRKPTTRTMHSDISTCYKDPDQPGPGHYDPRSPRKPGTTANYPFDSNIEYVRPVARVEIRPGPGRYKVRDTKSVKGHGWTWIFNSKVPRTIDYLIQKSYRSF